jgi:hydroxymethylbilane synthase
LAQIELFRRKILAIYPELQINVAVTQTAGDIDQTKPLHLVEGKNFFTADVQRIIRENSADFAVHSMKDVSSIDFFSNSAYAIIDRDIMHDVAIFRADIIDRLQQGTPITIGTSSPRRSRMAVDFLIDHLPQFGQPLIVNVQPVRGNVDIRLQKLEEGLYDGLILAGAGLNRLLDYAPSSATIRTLLSDKKLMLLPLFECPPAIGQGAIVVEADPANNDAIVLLNAIRDKALTESVVFERQFAERYGYGCSQQFGAFHLLHPAGAFSYAAGIDQTDNEFSEWDFLVPEINPAKSVFSCSDHMQSFFEYEFLTGNISATHSSLFVSSHRAVTQDFIDAVTDKHIWAAGTKTWRALAKEGIWVDGCADSLGLEYLEHIWRTPLFHLLRSDVQIITSEQSAQRWLDEGWNATAFYRLKPAVTKEVREAVGKADVVFWTSYQLYQILRDELRPQVQHCSLSGKTSELLAAEGLHTIQFPTIKAFKQWQQKINKESCNIT